MKFTTYFVAFLLSFFICLSIYLYYNLVPIQQKFVIEPFVSTADTSNIVPALYAVPQLPMVDYNYILLTTFENGKTVFNNNLRWYDNKIDINNIIMTENNQREYFAFSNPITLVQNTDILRIQGANINNIQLTGPISFYFANNPKMSYVLSEFTTIFIVRFNDFRLNSTLFEMVANTKVVDMNDVPHYIPQSFTINLARTEKNNINLEIVYGSIKYIVPDLNKDSILNNNIHLLAVTYNNYTLQVVFNDKTYKFTLDKVENIVLGSLPVLVNKGGEINMVLYAMAFYKKVLSLEDMTNFQNYVIFNLSKIYDLVQQNNRYLQNLSDFQKNSQNANANLSNLRELLNKCLQNKTEKETTLPLIEKRTKNIIPPLDPIPYPQTMTI